MSSLTGHGMDSHRLAGNSVEPPEKRNKTARFKQSLVWWCFAPVVEPERLVKEAAAIGFTGIELAPQQYWDMITENNLQITSIHGHPLEPSGLNRRENHSHIEDELRASIESAVKYNIPNLVCFSGNRQDLSDAEGIENTAEGLRRVAKIAAEKKVTLCLELLNSKVDHPDYHADHTWWGVEVCKRVNSPAVKLLYDVYHMQVMEGDLIRNLQQNIAHIAHFHTAGNPGRLNLDDMQEINYRGIVKAIVATSYAGDIGHEFTPKGNPVKALQRAFKLFDV